MHARHARADRSSRASPAPSTSPPAPPSNERRRRGSRRRGLAATLPGKRPHRAGDAARQRVQRVGADAQFPATLVAYDASGRVIGLDKLPGPPHAGALPGARRLGLVAAPRAEAVSAPRPRRADARRRADPGPEPGRGRGRARQARARDHEGPPQPLAGAALLLRRYASVRRRGRSSASQRLTAAARDADRVPRPWPRRRAARTCAQHDPVRLRDTILATYGRELGVTTDASSLGAGPCGTAFRGRGLGIDVGIEPYSGRPFLSLARRR